MTNGESAGGKPSSEETEKAEKIAVTKDKSKREDKSAIGSSQESVPKLVSKNVSKTNSCYKASASPLFKGNKGAPECGRCCSDQVVREGLSCYLCNDLFHACCREPGAISTSSTAICPKSSYNVLSTLIRKEISDAHKDRWGQFMFLCNKCKKRVVDLKNKGSSSKPSPKMVSVACDGGIDYEHKSSNTDDYVPETNNCTKINESPESNVSGSSLEKILASFKDQVLDSVDSLMSRKLDSYSSFITRTPRPSSDSSIADSVSGVSELSLASSNSLGDKSYLRAFQSTPLPMKLGNCMPSASTSSIDKAVKEIRREVDDLSNSEEHVVVLRSEDDSVNVIDEKKRVTNALKMVPITI